MNLLEQNFDAYAFSKQPGYHEPTVRKEFAKAVPLRTVVVYCYDPRAVGIPAAVAKEFGEVYPGDIITDAQGNKVASTTSLFNVVVAGGRAVDALRSITVYAISVWLCVYVCVWHVCVEHVRCTCVYVVHAML